MKANLLKSSKACMDSPTTSSADSDHDLAYNWGAGFNLDLPLKSVVDMGGHFAELSYLTDCEDAEKTRCFEIFRQRIADCMSGRNFRVVEDSDEEIVLSPFLKIGSPMKALASGWPLWSHRLMRDIQRCGNLKLPVTAVQKELRGRRNVVMIGVSGSGKSRTCYDICRGETFCLYWDWAGHRDLDFLLSCLLELIPPKTFYASPEKQQFRLSVETFTMRMILCRLVILELCLERAHVQGTRFTPDDFFQFQQSSNDSDSCVFTKANMLCSELSPSIICNAIFKEPKKGVFTLFSTKSTGCWMFYRPLSTRALKPLLSPTLDNTVSPGPTLAILLRFYAREVFQVYGQVPTFA